MMTGIVYRVWPAASELHVSNKYTKVNQRLKTKAELMPWLLHKETHN